MIQVFHSLHLDLWAGEHRAHYCAGWFPMLQTFLPLAVIGIRTGISPTRRCSPSTLALYFTTKISTCTENVKFQAETVVFVPGTSTRQ